MFLWVVAESLPMALKSFSAAQPCGNTGRGKETCAAAAIMVEGRDGGSLRWHKAIQSSCERNYFRVCQAKMEVPRINHGTNRRFPRAIGVRRKYYRVISTKLAVGSASGVPRSSEGIENSSLPTRSGGRKFPQQYCFMKMVQPAKSSSDRSALIVECC